LVTALRLSRVLPSGGSGVLLLQVQEELLGLLEV
jgi:hypothetical protein